MLTHDKLRARAAQDQSSARVDLLTRICASDPASMTGKDFQSLARLTPRQRESAFRALSKKRPVPTRRSGNKNVRPLTKFRWRSFPAAIRVHVIVGFIALSAGCVWPCYAIFSEWRISGIPISVDLRSWPPCARLSLATDACIYQVDSGITWDEVSADLALPALTILQTNQHLRNRDAGLLAGDLLVVWRGKRTLLGGSNDQ